MGSYDAETLLHRFDLADKARQNFVNIYKRVYHYVLPDQDTFYQHTAAITGQDLYTSLPQILTDEFSDSMQQALTPFGGKWIFLGLTGIPRKDLSPDEEAALLRIEDKAHDAVMRSNFHTEISSAFYDLAVGTMGLWVGQEKDPDVLHFEHMPLSEIILERDRSCYRSHKLTLREAVNKFGMDPFKAHFESVASTPALDRGKTSDSIMTKEVALVELAIRTGEYSEDGDDKPSGPFMYAVLDKEKKAFVTKQSFAWNPMLVTRWTVVKGERFGRGPALHALHDVKQLNMIIKLILTATWRKVSPTTIAADDGVFNPNFQSLLPGTVTPVRSTNPSSPYGRPQILEEPSQLDIGIIQQSRLESQIGDHLLSETFGDLDNPSKSPEEISVRHQRFLRRIGGKYPRLIMELMRPLVHGIIEVLKLKGKIADELAELPSDKLEYAPPQSPGEKLRVFESVQALAGFMNTIFPGAALAVMEIVEVIPRLADALEIPPDMIKSDAALMQTLEQALQALQTTQAAPAGSV